MRVKTLSEAGRFVDRVGFAYVFPDNRIPLPSLWGAIQGNPARPMDPDDWGWTKSVARAWDLKDALGEKRRAWFGRFFRGKGSLISLDMLPPLYRLVNGEVDLPVARTMIGRLRNVGALSTLHLRRSLNLEGSKGNAQFSKITVACYRKLLIANIGVDESETQWPAAIIGLFEKCYPGIRREAARLSEAEAVRRILSKAPDVKPRTLSTLFGLPRFADSATMPRP